VTMLLLSTADTELLAARAGGAAWRVANPGRVEPAKVAGHLDGVDVVVVRLLGGVQSWADGLDAVVAAGLPVVALGGEAAPDAALIARSTVPAGVATQALAYLVEDGPEDLRELYGFLSDTLLLTGHGFAPPQVAPAYGIRPGRPRRGGRPVVGVVYYRAHELPGNTGFVDALTEAIEAAGADALPVFCGSLRGADPELMALLADSDALVVTVLAAGGAVATDAAAGGNDDAWDVGALAALDVPVLQAL
jgi:cobaltochelatase CobN